MKLSGLARGIVLFGLVALGSANSARADDAPNPKYTAWANFKPGSFSTVEADMESRGNKFHITTTRTLISIDGDKAVVQTKSTVSVAGNDHEAAPRTDTILAKSDPETFKQTGEKDIDAMGKTFKCKVFDAAGNPDAKPDKSGPGNLDDMKATVYVCSDVPGGLVRLEGVSKTGKEMTFILTGMEAK